MLARKLSPEEKRRLKKLMGAAKKEKGFILRQKVRIILVLLGAKSSNKILQASALDILRDVWPFKARRLRKLIDGRRSR